MTEFSHNKGVTQPPLLECTIGGASDEKYGEEVCAWVIAKPGTMLVEADIIAHCKGQIAYYKVPRYVKIVDEFVMTVTGKAQKFEMRKSMEAELLDLAEA